MTFAADVWKTLSSVDVTPHIERKGNLSYLSWAWAWGVLMETYPESNFFFEDHKEYHDGSIEVRVVVTVTQGDHNLVRTMWLPVMDNRNKAIEVPNARDISDAKMRCLVKCLALFGLGHFLYAGEDTPKPAIDSPISQEKVDWVTQALLDTEASSAAFAAWLQGKFGVSYISEVRESQWKEVEGAVLRRIEKYREEYAKGEAA